MQRLIPLCTVLSASLACGGLLEPQSHTSEDGRFQVTAPPSYVLSEDLHPQAVLALQRSFPETYLLILADERVDLVEEMSFEQRSLNIRDQTTASLGNVRLQEPVSLTIDGHPAMRMRFDGEMDGLDLGYLHTTVLTDQAFVQVVIWGMADQVEGDTELEELAGSFVQMGPMKPDYLASLYGEQPPKPFRSSEHTRLEISGDWERASADEANPDASLELEHQKLDLALLVISEPIADTELETLPAFSKLTTEQMGPAMGATRYELGEPAPFTAGPLEGMLVEIDADVLGYQFAGLHLSLMSEERFHQLWVWGPKSQIDRHDAELRAALASFQEL